MASRPLAILVLAAALGACATSPTLTLPPMESWAERQRVLGSVGAWRARGRIGLVAGEQAESGSLDWRQDGDAVSVSIRGPLGAGGLTLEGGGGTLTLTAADGETLVLTDPEAELRELYGWTIPVTSLAWWMLGLPDPGREAVTTVGDGGRLERLEQAAWDIRYREYRPAAGAMLPYRVKAESGDIRLTMVLRDWQFGPAASR